MESESGSVSESSNPTPAAPETPFLLGYWDIREQLQLVRRKSEVLLIPINSTSDVVGSLVAMACGAVS